MAIYYANSFDDDDQMREWLFGQMADETICFLCGDPLSFPVVTWMGSTGYIYFHSECATSFIISLSRDTREIEANLRRGAITPGGELQ